MRTDPTLTCSRRVRLGARIFLHAALIVLATFFPTFIRRARAAEVLAYVIPPGRELIVQEMLGARASLPDGCSMTSASIERTFVRALYTCDVSSNASIELHHPTASTGAVRTTRQFAIVAHEAPDALVDVVAALVAQHETDWSWVEVRDAGSADRKDSSAPREPSVLTRMWQSRWVGLLWWLLPPAIFSSIAGARRRPRVVLIVVCATILALLVRFAVSGGPANHYTEILGPWDAASASFVPRAGGADGLYRAIDWLMPLSSRGLLGLQRVLGSLSVGLVVLALGIGTDRGRSSDTVLALIALLLAIDPLEARLAASDAMHVPALFAFSVGALVFAQASTDQRSSAWRTVFIAGCALLPGLARVELAPMPILWLPLFANWKKGVSRLALLRGPGGAHVAVLAAVVLAFVLSSAGFGEPIGSVTWPHVRDWFGSLLAFFARDWGERWTSIVLARVALLGTAVGFVLGARRPIVLACTAVALHAARMATPLAGAGASNALAYARHDVVFEIVVVVLAGWGWEAIVRASTSHGNGRAVSTAAMGASLLAPARTPPPYEATFVYQDEYTFLARELPHVEPSCDIVTVWALGGGGVAFESVLAMPHPLVAYDDRQRHWIIVQHRDDVARIDSTCAVYFDNGFCQLDPGAVIGARSASDVATLQELAPVCASLNAATTSVIAQQQVTASALLWPFRDAVVELSLGRLDLGRFRAGLSNATD
jgi:hypothetical protein